MRQPFLSPFVRSLLIALAFVLVGRGSSVADDRSQARTHYQAGVKYYSGGDYRSAIREFSSAQQLVPADLNNYNLALCYDKLGDPEPAVRYYREYLDRVPTTDKRAEIEASISRLDAAAKSAAKKAEAARKAEDARLAAEAARKAEDDRQAAEAARKAEDARRAAEAVQPSDPPTGGGVAPPTGLGSTGTPGTGLVSTGDAQLDRAQGMSIDQIRDQRIGGAGSGMPDPSGGPAINGAAPTGGELGSAPNAGGPPPPATAAGAAPQGGPQDQPKKADPVYKKWWFWAVVAVSAYVVYQIATEDSQPGTRARLLLPVGPAPQQPGGLTLMRW